MKKYLLTFVALIASLLSFAAQVDVVTFPMTDQASVSAYQSEWTGKTSNGEWTFTNFNNNNNGWAFIKCGWKTAETTSTITSPALIAEVDNVVYTFDKTSGVTSAKFEVLNGETVVSSSDVTIVAGEVTCPVTGSKAGYSYKLTIENEKVSSNGTTQLSQITVNGTAAEAAVEAPVFTPAAGTYYGAANVYATCATEGATIQYSLNDGEWTAWPAAYDAEHPAGVLITETATLKAKAVKGGDESTITSAKYIIGKEYANLAALAAVEPIGQPVRVTLFEVAIDSIYTTKAGKRNGVYVSTGLEAKPAIEIYCYDVPETWEVGGKISGTLEGDWKNYYGTWEVCPKNWDALTYSAPAALATINIDNAGKVKIVNENREEIALYDGAQKLSAGQYMVSPSQNVGDYKLNAVALNGETIAPVYGTSYMVELAAGDVMDITADYDVEEYAVTFNDPAAIAAVICKGDTLAIGSTLIENQEVHNWTAVPAGYKVNIILNEGYTSESELNFYATENHEIVTEKLSNIVVAEGGVVGEIATITIKARNGEMIAPSGQDACVITLMNKETRETVYSWDAETITGADMVYDEETYMPVAVKLTVDPAITAAGTYDLIVPAGTFYVGEDMVESDATGTSFVIEAAPATGIQLATAELNANGGKLTFDQTVAFADFAEEITCNVSGVKTKNIAAQATLTLDWDDWKAVNVTFSEALEAGDYTLDIPAGVIIDGDQGTTSYAGGQIAFTVEEQAPESELICTFTATPVADYETFCGTATFEEWSDKIVIKNFDGTEGNDLVINWDETGYTTINGEACPWVYMNNAELPYYGAYLYATDGYTGGNWTAEEGGSFWIGGYFYKDANDGGTWGYMYWNLASASTDATLTIDNAEKVKIYTEQYEELTLVDGAQKLSEGTYMVMSKNYSYYLNKVELNGEEVEETWGYYNVTVKAGDKLNITADYETASSKVEFSLPYRENTADVVKNVTHSGASEAQIEGWPTGMFEAANGYKLDIMLDEANYAVDSVLVNNKQITGSYGFYSCVVKGFTSVEIFARAKGLATVVVDDANKVKLINSAYEQIALINGDQNQVAEGQYMIQNADYSYYINKVELNGEEVAATYGYWNVELKTNDVLKITALYDASEYAVTVNAPAGAISSVTTATETITDLSQSFNAPAGYVMTITPNSAQYKINSVTVNGQAVSYYSGNIEVVVKGETTIDIDATEKSTVAFTINVDAPEAVKVYGATSPWSYDSSAEVQLEIAGANAVTLAEDYTYVAIKKVAGAYINSVKVGDTEYTADYYGVIYVPVTAGTTIDIKAGMVVMDSKATIVLKDKATANYGVTFEDSERNSIDLVEGEQTLEFSSSANTYTLGAYGNDMSNMVVYINGEVVAPRYEGSSSYELSLKDGDFVEIYLNGGDSEYDATAIRGIAAEAGKTIYNLAGQKLNKLQRGINIVNGKKIMVK